jgi:hypothetical protein
MSKFTPAQLALAQLLGSLMESCENDEEFFSRLDSIFELCESPTSTRKKVIEIVKTFSEMSHEEIDQIDAMSGITWLIEQATKE